MPPAFALRSERKNHGTKLTPGSANATSPGVLQLSYRVPRGQKTGTSPLLPSPFLPPDIGKPVDASASFLGIPTLGAADAGSNGTSWICSLPAGSYTPLPVPELPLYLKTNKALEIFYRPHF